MPVITKWAVLTLVSGAVIPLMVIWGDVSLGVVAFIVAVAFTGAVLGKALSNWRATSGRERRGSRSSQQS